ncbi:ADP-ribosylation factor-like protein [Methanopyrus sp.]
MIRADRDSIKISFIGPEDAGKTTSVRQLSSKFMTISPKGKTVGIDFGKYKHDDSVYLFGVPGSLMFKFVIKIGVRGSDGLVLVIDSSDPKIDEARKLYEVAKRVVDHDNVVVFANKQDLPDALPPEEIREIVEEELGLTDPPTFGTVATEGVGLEEGVEELLSMIQE